MFETDKRPHITVVGDLILDRYLIGDATKLNPEQPGVVIRVDKEEDRLGGAAAVAMIAAGFGARVTLAGVLGRDEPGRRLQQLLVDHDIEPQLWIDDRPTTWKQRIVARGQLRPDRCDREVTTRISDSAARFLSTAPIGDVLLISDYAKGVCTSGMLQALGDRARAAGVPILVDPARGRNWSDYGQVTAIKSNWVEAKEASGNRDFTPLALARRLADHYRCSIVVTLGRYGMVVVEREGAIWYLPANPIEVRDVSGAGDTVFATIGMEILRGSTLRDASKAAAVAAGCQLTSLGIRCIP